MTTFWALLGQSTHPVAPPQPGALDFLRGPFIPVILMIGVFYWILMRGQRKEQRRYQDMLAALKRNDRVQTVGGILGTVVDVRGDEVVVKVDEANNVKLRFVRSAIKTVIADTSPDKKEPSKT